MQYKFSSTFKFKWQTLTAINAHHTYIYHLYFQLIYDSTTFIITNIKLIIRRQIQYYFHDEQYQDDNSNES